jgi:hypothetical protein
MPDGIAAPLHEAGQKEGEQETRFRAADPCAWS